MEKNHSLKKDKKEKSNWLKSLSSSSSSSSSRHRKTSSNKENTTQNMNICSDDSDSSECTTRSNKKKHTSVLCTIARRLNLKFLSQKAVTVATTATASANAPEEYHQIHRSHNQQNYQQHHHHHIPQEHHQSHDIIRPSIDNSPNSFNNSSQHHHLESLLHHQSRAVSNDYVEVPTPAMANRTHTVSNLNNIQSNALNQINQQPLNDQRQSIAELPPLDNDSLLYLAVRRSPMSPWELHPTNQNEMAMLNARILMTNYGWYRGSMSRSMAQKKLAGQPNGSFLLRNSQTNGYHFTLSFRSAGNTLHCRIEYNDGHWTIESAKYISIVDLIEDAMQQSKDHIFCYVKQSSQLQPPYPVRLTNPISKFDEVPSLQHICRYVIRCSDNVQNIDCLPPQLQEYVRANKYLNIRLDYFEDV